MEMSSNKIAALFDGCDVKILNGIIDPVIVTTSCRKFIIKIYEIDEPDQFRVQWYYTVNSNTSHHAYDELATLNKLREIAVIIKSTTVTNPEAYLYIRSKLVERSIPKWEDM